MWTRRIVFAQFVKKKQLARLRARRFHSGDTRTELSAAPASALRGRNLPGL